MIVDSNDTPSHSNYIERMNKLRKIDGKAHPVLQHVVKGSMHHIFAQSPTLNGHVHMSWSFQVPKFKAFLKKSSAKFISIRSFVNIF